MGILYSKKEDQLEMSYTEILVKLYDYLRKNKHSVIQTTIFQTPSIRIII